MGSLKSLLAKKRTAINREVKMKISDDIAAGLHSMHSCDIVHNDVKCSNILVFSLPSEQNIVAKISDFGSSVLLASVVKLSELGE